MRDNTKNDGFGDLIVRDAAASVLAELLSHLREIKNMEMAWLDRYSVVTLPFVIFLFSQDQDKFKLSSSALLFSSVVYFFIACWIQEVLLKERRSYYRVLRSVIRLENYLGLFNKKLFPESMTNAGFVKGVGPNREKDGTQPFSSFLHRMIYSWVIYVFIMVGVIYRGGSWLNAVLVLINLVWVILIFIRDRSYLHKDALIEKNLAGAEKEWYPD